MRWIVIVTFFFLACQSNTEDKKYRVFHYNQINPITSLDPAFAKSQNNIWATLHVFDGLVALDDSLNVVPAIAHSWEVSEDGKSYQFNLRKDVLFHDDPCFEGQPRNVNALDVKYSLERIIDNKINSPGSWLFNGRVDSIRPFEVLDDSTIVIHLQEAFRPFLGILGMQYCSIIPHEAVAYYGSKFRSHPVGTGPFKFKRWLENQALFLVKNETYFKGPSALDGVRTSFITDRKIAFLELLNGNVEFVSGLESSFINELLDQNGNLLEAAAEKIQFVKGPYLNTEYLGINMEMEGPLSHKYVRQAMNYSIDRSLMLKSLRNNVGAPADAGFVPKGLPSFNKDKVKGYNLDLEKAKELLEAAGFPGGKGLPELVLHTNNDYLDLCTYITKAWEKIGLRVKIEMMESAVLRDGMRKSKVPFFRASWIADYPDAESYFCMFYSKNPAPPNYTRFSNARFDQLYEQVIKENDDTKRHTLYWEMDNILVEEAPVIFLFYDETALFASKKIKGISKNALNLLHTYQLQEEL